MNKLTKCKDSHREMLLEYLREEAVRNTFLIGDIINYGFEDDIQQVWADIEDGVCSAVYLWFCNNLLIYSKNKSVDENSLLTILQMKEPAQVMAKRGHLEQVMSMLDDYILKNKTLLAFYNKKIKDCNQQQSYQYNVGTLHDVDKIYDFLQSGELAPLYGSKEMIKKRIKTGEGVHFFVEKEGDMIAHINSAASTPYSTMIGGLYTKKEYRSQGLGTFLSQRICEKILNDGRIPCLFSAQEPEKNLLYEIGFEEVDEFTTLEKM